MAHYGMPLNSVSVVKVDNLFMIFMVTLAIYAAISIISETEVNPAVDEKKSMTYKAFSITLSS